MSTGSKWFDPEAARGNPRLAGIGRRIGARAIDYVVVFLILYVIIGLIIQPDVKNNTPDLGLTLLSAFVALLYEVPSTAVIGQTIGKRILRIRVVRFEDGGMPGANRSLLRYFTLLVLGLIPVLGVFLAPIAALWFIWDPRRQNIPDKMARTLVVNVGMESTGVIDAT